MIAPTIAALILTYAYHLSVPETVIGALLGGGGLAGVYQAWPRSSRADATRPIVLPPDLEAAAKELAALVEAQWTEELVRRQLNDDVPLWVSWEAADPRLTTGWNELTEMATEAAGGTLPPPGTWARAPVGLAGSGHLAPVLKLVPTGRLVVLGEPGAGKTMLMVRLLLDLLAERKLAERSRTRPLPPVPVLVSIAKWDPEETDENPGQSLNEFLEDRLIREYPFLDREVLTPKGEMSQIGAMLHFEMIVPVLDGLDEIPERWRGPALARVNQTLKGTGPLLITCRPEEYAATVNGPHGLSVPLRGAAAVELQPLRLDHITRYLTSTGPSAVARWKQVLEKLKGDGPLVQALSTPLFVTLARAIYNPRQGEDLSKVQPPDTLLQYTDKDKIEENLLRKFIPAAYRPHDKLAKKAEEWLGFLAEFLSTRAPAPGPTARQETSGRDSRQQSNPLRWWELRDAGSHRFLVPAVVGTVCGIAVALAAGLGTHVGVGIGVGFGVGMLAALAVGLGFRRWSHFSGRPGWGMAGGLAGAVIGGVAAGVAGRLGFGYEHSLFSGLPEALGIGIGAGASTRLDGGFIGGLVGGFAAGVLEGFGLGLPAALVNGLGVGLAVGLAVQLVGRREPTGQPPQWGPVGIAGGLVIGLAVGLIVWRQEGPYAGLGFGAAIGAVATWPFGLRERDPKQNQVASPYAAMARDLKTFLRTSLAAGLAAACAGFLGGGLSSIVETTGKVSVHSIISDGLGIGLASGLVIGLTFGCYHAASPAFLITSWWLAARGKTPLRLMRFLDDAHNKSVLRQDGVEYQFRHQSLQEYLARTYRTRHRLAVALPPTAPDVAVVPALPAQADAAVGDDHVAQEPAS